MDSSINKRFFTKKADSKIGGMRVFLWGVLVLSMLLMLLLGSCGTPAGPTPDCGQLDSDGDGRRDLCDNCPASPNADQKDSDVDGVGDACDTCPYLTGQDSNDKDGDGIGDSCDSCPNISNPDQAQPIGLKAGGMVFPGGDVVHHACPILLPSQIYPGDTDHDGLMNNWEDWAANALNPDLILDEEEDWLSSDETPLRHVSKTRDPVFNFVRVTPMYDRNNPSEKYIVFFYAVTWQRDYGRFAEAASEWGKDSTVHAGDVERIILVYHLATERDLRLRWVFTSAHGGPTDHSGVWSAEGETCNEGHIANTDGVEIGTQRLCAVLQRSVFSLSLWVSEDKHATYPTEDLCEDVILVKTPWYSPNIGEDCGGGGDWRFKVYNAGEPVSTGWLMDDVSNLFPPEPASKICTLGMDRCVSYPLGPREFIWSDPDRKFCGGLRCYGDPPDYIGYKLIELPQILCDKVNLSACLSPAPPTATGYVPPPAPPTATQYIPSPAPPTATQYVPSAISPTAPDVRTPEGFLRYYFDLVTKGRDYHLAWSLLTPKFRKANNPGGFEEYADFWKKIEQADLNNIDIDPISETSVNCRIDITFHTVSGDIDNEILNYRLIYNKGKQTWMFDSP